VYQTAISFDYQLYQSTEVRTEIRDLCISSWVSGSMTATHDPYDPFKLGDPFDPWPTDPYCQLLVRDRGLDWRPHFQHDKIETASDGAGNEYLSCLETFSSMSWDFHIQITLVVVEGRDVRPRTLDPPGGQLSYAPLPPLYYRFVQFDAQFHGSSTECNELDNVACWMVLYNNSWTK